MDERVNRLIDAALERMSIESQTKDLAVLELLAKIGRQKNVLEKVASFVHLFSLYYRASKVEYVEFAKTVAQCEPSAPDGVDAMVKWYPLFAHERKREQERCDRAFKQMAQRLTKIQDAVRNLSVHLPRINELEQKNASMESDLDSATTELQRLKEEVRDKDRIIQDLSDRSSSSSSVERISSDKHNRQLKSIETETDEGAITIQKRNREIAQLKSELASLKDRSQTCDITLTNVKAIKQQVMSEYREKEEKLMFEIEALKEKCIIMRNDLNHEIRRRRESEVRVLTLNDQLQEKKVECHALQSRLDTLTRAQLPPGSEFE